MHIPFPYESPSPISKLTSHVETFAFHPTPGVPCLGTDTLLLRAASIIDFEAPVHLD